MSLKLRIRKETAERPELRWRVEIATEPVGEGVSVGEPSWVDAMLAARSILRDAAGMLAEHSRTVNQ